MAKFATRNGRELLVLDELAPFGVDAVVTTISGGVSQGPYASLNLGLHVGDEPQRVVENRTRVADALGYSLDDFVFMNHTHCTRVATIDASSKGRGARFDDNAVIATDALITTTHAIPLVVLVADCCPIVIVDPTVQVLGVAHAGWRGTADGVTLALIESMTQLGASPASMHAVIGPSIDLGRYEIGPEVVEALASSLKSDITGCIDQSSERPHIDVAAVNRLQMLEAGIPDTSLSITPQRTDDVHFFSDRAVRPCGRFALIASLIQ